MFLIFYGKIEKKISINKEDFLHREEERMKEPVLIVMAAGMGSRRKDITYRKEEKNHLGQVMHYCAVRML